MHAKPFPRAADQNPTIGAVRHFAAEATIYAQGERATHIVLVLHGLVRICGTFPDGRRFISTFLAAGQIFGFEHESTHHAAAEAVCDTTAIFYPARDPAAPTPLPPQIEHALLLHNAQARNHARLLARFSAIEKLSAFLLECSGRAKSRDLITLEMTRQDIADYLGLTVETISRGLAQLKRDRVIAFITTRQLKLLNLASLEAES
jgi:CRP/FNR family nitrogen fixation transcriptional regulator